MYGPLPAQRPLSRAGEGDEKGGRGPQGNLQGREKTAYALSEEFVELYGKGYPKAVSVFEAGVGDALAYLRYPGSHHARVRSTNVLERVCKEVKSRTRVVGVFPKETSAQTLATEIMLRSSEEWALKRYLSMATLEAVEKPNPQLSRR